MSDKGEIEARLLKEPFNLELRLAYAQLMADEGDAQAALDQFRLVKQQAPERAAAHFGVARCLLALERREEALDAYVESKQCDDFSPQTDLEELAAAARTTAPRLSVVGDAVTTGS